MGGGGRERGGRGGEQEEESKPDQDLGDKARQKKRKTFDFDKKVKNGTS